MLDNDNQPGNEYDLDGDTLFEHIVSLKRLGIDDRCEIIHTAGMNYDSFISLQDSVSENMWKKAENAMVKQLLVAWCMPDYLKATGVKYLNIGINETRSIRPFDRPTCFWWKSQAEERLLAYRSDHAETSWCRNKLISKGIQESQNLSL